MATGHEVTSLAGHPSSELGVRSVVGDIRARDVMQQALFGAEAVIAAVGPRGNHPAEVVALEQGMRNLVMVATQLGVKRLVVLSGAAVDVIGDRKPVLGRLASAVVRGAGKHVVGAKQREFAVVSASELAWTALRPPLVSDGPARGYRLDLQLRPGARVTREDVARALVDQLVDRTFLSSARHSSYLSDADDQSARMAFQCHRSSAPDGECESARPARGNRWAWRSGKTDSN